MFDIKENLKMLPDKPGVYLHKDKFGQVIYVGKAVSLKNRVRQYFQSSKNMEPKVRAMVSHIEEFDYITTSTEMEALILENNLIKKYMPKYNVLLRDDKTYPYIKICTNEQFPRILKTRMIMHDGCKYFGPYADTSAVNQLIDLLNSIFALKRCSTQKFPEGFKPCLNYHISQCKGICTGLVSKEEYRKAIDQVIELLNGKDKKILDYLNRKMLQEAEAMNFEKAAEYRDYIAAVCAITEKQRVVLLTAGDMDVILCVKGLNNAHVILFFVRGGKLNGRESYHLQAMEEDDVSDIVSAFVKQYYSDKITIPKEILVENELADKKLLEEWLSGIRGNQVKISVPRKGDKKELLNMAKRDVIEMMKTLDERANLQRKKEVAINDALESFVKGMTVNDSMINDDKKENHPKDGWRVEAYDISNTTGLVIFGKNNRALQSLNEMIRDRWYIRKFYLTIVHGELNNNLHLKDRIEKDERINKVRVIPKDSNEGKIIETIAKPIKTKNGYSLIEVELITGRTHQIRAHLASAGYPVIGDAKYGESRKNKKVKGIEQEFHLTTQLLHAYKLLFEGGIKPLEYMKGLEVKANLTSSFETIITKLFRTNNIESK
jgi:excinuclease ABC subunit C